MTIDDMRTVLNAVWNARQRWFDIGLELDLSVSDLNAIKTSNDNIIYKCINNMLIVWLRRSNPPPTWSALVGALRSPVVGCEELAKRVEREITDLGPAIKVQVGEFIGWHTCKYCVTLNVSDKIILGI